METHDFRGGNGNILENLEDEVYKHIEVDKSLEPDLAKEIMGSKRRLMGCWQ